MVYLRIVTDSQDLSVEGNRLLSERLWVADVAHNEVGEGIFLSSLKLLADFPRSHNNISAHSILCFLNV